MAVRRVHQRIAVPVVYIAAMFMSVLDTTIVTVALPAIGRDLGGARDAGSGLALVSIGYLIALGVFIPVSGWVGDRFGGRRTLLGAIALFTLASLLCGCATSLPELIAFRFLQGIGGALMTPVGLTLLFRVYPPAERVRVASIVTVFVTLGPALGPVLGGVFTTYLTWRLAFLVNLPVGVAALIFGSIHLDAHEQPHPGRLDLSGLLLSGVGLMALLYGVSAGPEQGWGKPMIIAAIVVGVAGLGALILRELRAEHPLVQLRLFSHRLFGAATALYAIGSIAFIGTLFLVALLFQDELGLSAVQSGLTSFPSAIGTMLGAQLVTRQLYWRFGPRRITALGLLILAAADGMLSQVTDGTNLWLVRGVMLGLGFGVALVFVPAQAAVMATIPKAQTAQASAIFNAGKQVGSALGVALLSTVLALGTGADRVATSAGYRDAFWAAAVVAGLGVLVSLSIRDADAADTMTRPPDQRSTAIPVMSASSTAATSRRASSGSSDSAM